VLQRVRNEAITNQQATALARWVLDGINSLRETAAEAQNLGQMGWASDPDNFILGMRVIFAADVVLEWISRSSKGIRNGSRIRKALRNLADIGREAQLHDLWLGKIEAILHRSIMLRLSQVTRGLSNVAILAK